MIFFWTIVWQNIDKRSVRLNQVRISDSRRSGWRNHKCLILFKHIFALLSVITGNINGLLKFVPQKTIPFLHQSTFTCMERFLYSCFFIDSLCYYLPSLTLSSCIWLSFIRESYIFYLNFSTFAFFCSV